MIYLPMRWFSQFMLNRDSFGEPIQVSYKGRETKDSIIGGILTLFLKGLMMLLVYKAIIELVMMNDPKISSFTKPLSKAEKADLVPV